MFRLLWVVLAGVPRYLVNITSSDSSDSGNTSMSFQVTQMIVGGENVMIVMYLCHDQLFVGGFPSLGVYLEVSTIFNVEVVC